MQNLSNDPAVKNSLAASSMSAGNRTSTNTDAMTAAGSQPVDPEIADVDQGQPQIEIPAENTGDRHLARGDKAPASSAPKWVPTGTSGYSAGLWPGRGLAFRPLHGAWSARR